MATSFFNPIAQERAETMRALDRSREPAEIKALTAKLEDLEEQNRELIQKRLAEHKSNISKIEERHVEVKKPELKITTQYKEACDIYREADDLIKAIRETKKEIRETIARKRANKSK